MMNESMISQSLSATQFAEGLLAGLAVAHNRQITANQSQLHRAFRKVLSQAKLNPNLNLDASDIDYDPLYGLSGWLDEFLARAQRDLLISSPNPSYGRIEIKVTESEGEALLSNYPNGDILKDLSRVFFEQLQR